MIVQTTKYIMPSNMSTYNMLCMIEHTNKYKEPTHMPTYMSCLIEQKLSNTLLGSTDSTKS